MRKKIYLFVLSLLILSTNAVLGDGSNKTKPNKSSHNKHHTGKVNTKNNDRPKRSVDDFEYPHWLRRGKTELLDYSDITKDPFWGTRGRREGSTENYEDGSNVGPCENCYAPSGDRGVITYGNLKHTRDDIMSPFWGNRGRRYSEEFDEDEVPEFWGSRGRRQENEPFWGNRGRREEDDSPFWGQRGRREEDPFWGNRGRRHEEPFWGNRGKWGGIDSYWDDRGRREEEPFWGNRGRRENYESLWDNRGHRKETDPFWSSRGRRKQEIKESILNAINNVEDDIENLSRLRRSNDDPNPFWQSKSKESKPKQAFNMPLKSNILQSRLKALLSSDGKTPDPGTVLDNRMYADEPDYILVDRTSRSSSEMDPYYISRGKKYYMEYDLGKIDRDRRGAIEEIVKSVRNDPFYIARGKKDDGNKIGNSTQPHDEFAKVKELICATLDLVMSKNGGNKVKRDWSEAERERRTTLKKLAAQLQADPYFVSRGRRGIDLRRFIDQVAAKCH